MACCKRLQCLACGAAARACGWRLFPARQACTLHARPRPPGHSPSVPSCMLCPRAQQAHHGDLDPDTLLDLWERGALKELPGGRTPGAAADLCARWGATDTVSQQQQQRQRSPLSPLAASPAVAGGALEGRRRSAPLPALAARQQAGQHQHQPCLATAVLMRRCSSWVQVALPIQCWVGWLGKGSSSSSSSSSTAPARARLRGRPLLTAWRARARHGTSTASQRSQPFCLSRSSFFLTSGSVACSHDARRVQRQHSSGSGTAAAPLDGSVPNLFA